MKHYFGNAIKDSRESKGWFIGNFIKNYIGQSKHLRVSDDIEIKWNHFKVGEGRSTWSRQKQETSISILIKGSYLMEFPDEQILLAKEGDYIIWPPLVPHKGNAKEDSIVLTIRCPSVPNDTEEVESL